MPRKEEREKEKRKNKEIESYLSNKRERKKESNYKKKTVLRMNMVKTL